MSTFTITVQDAPVRAVLQALERRMGDLRPVFQAIGEGMVERSKRRFETSTAPDNTPWAPYPVGGATLSMLATRLAGHRNKQGQRSYAYSKEGGALNAKGTRLLGSKKLLIGESQDLRRQIVPRASSHQLVVSATPVYAAMQQFGGTTGSGSMIPGKKIPARPFLPIKPDGTLYPQEQALVLQALNDFLSDF